MDSAPLSHARIAIARIGHQPIDEICGRGGQVQRVPAQAVGGVGIVAERRRPQAAVLCVTRKRRMRRRRTHAVKPAAMVLMTRRGESRRGKLFGVKAIGDMLRRITANRQRAGHGLRRMKIAKPRQHRPAILDDAVLCRGRPVGMGCVHAGPHVWTEITPRRIWSSSMLSNNA